jgi:predicted MFS family arabinose efflux permease
LVMARIFTGAFGGVLGGLCFTIVGDVVPGARRGRAMGIVMTSFSMASVFGVPFGLFLASYFSWHAPFIFLGCFGCLIFVLINRVVPSIPGTPARRSPLTLFREVMKDRSQKIAITLMSALMLAHFTLIPFLSPYLVSRVGFTEAQLAYIYLLGGLATIFSSPYAGRLSDRLGSARVFVTAVILTLAPILTLTHLGRVPLGFALIVTTVFFILGNSRMVSGMALVTSTVPSSHRAGFMSLNSSFQQMTSGVAAYIAGRIVTKAPTGELLHYNRVGYFAMVASMLCIWIALNIRPRVIENPA